MKIEMIDNYLCCKVHCHETSCLSLLVSSVPPNLQENQLFLPSGGQCCNYKYKILSVTTVESWYRLQLFLCKVL